MGKKYRWYLHPRSHSGLWQVLWVEGSCQKDRRGLGVRNSLWMVLETRCMVRRDSEFLISFLTVRNPLCTVHKTRPRAIVVAFLSWTLKSEGYPTCAPRPVHVQVQVQSTGWDDCIYMQPFSITQPCRHPHFIFRGCYLPFQRVRFVMSGAYHG